MSEVMTSNIKERTNLLRRQHLSNKEIVNVTPNCNGIALI
jgi:hypothetical protein